MKQEYDVIVVGTGAAGLYGALQFDSSVSVLLISKRELTLSNSSLAQGGVAAVLDLEHDDYQMHFEDTMIAGGRKNNPDAVKVLTTCGPSTVWAWILTGNRTVPCKRRWKRAIPAAGSCTTRILRERPL